MKASQRSYAPKTPHLKLHFRQQCHSKFSILFMRLRLAYYTNYRMFVYFMLLLGLKNILKPPRVLQARGLFAVVFNC